MATIKFFGSRDLALKNDLSSDIITCSYTESPYGSLDGVVQVEVTSANRAFLSSLDENSHYLKIASDSEKLVGGIVAAAYIDKGVCHISVHGLLEYFADVPLIASHKASSIAPSTTVPKEDPSWTKIFYSDSNLGLFYEIMKNLRETMVTQGFTPFFELQNVEPLISAQPQSDWMKSYRLNSLETPNVAEVYSDLAEDDEFFPIKVSVDSSNTFKWIMRGINSYTLNYIDESTDLVHGVSIERGERVNRSMALASGSDPKDNNLISRIDFSSTAAYSAAFAESSSKSSLDIERSNRASIAGANKRLDQLTFTTWNSGIDIFDAVSISGTYLPSTLAVVTEKNTEGQAVTYTATIVTSVADMIPGVKRPTSEARRLIYNPAKMGNRRSIREGLQKSNPTGWR